MEFLMTYGWAILVVLIVIGALAYFGVLDPSKLLPDKCTFPTGLYCEDYILQSGGTSDGRIDFVLQNGIGRDINITGIWAEESNAQASCSNTTIMADIISNGATYTVTLPCPGDSLYQGTKYKFNLNVSYTYVGSTFEHTMQGELFTRAET